MCGAFAFCVPCVCCLRSGLCFETLRLRFAFERSGRTPKVSCSLNGTPVKIVNFHMVGCSSHGSVEDKDWDSKLTPAIKEAAIVELARLYGGGASKPITIIGGTSTSRRGRRRSAARATRPSRRTGTEKLGWGLGICARPQAPARLKLPVASSIPRAFARTSPLRVQRDAKARGATRATGGWCLAPRSLSWTCATGAWLTPATEPDAGWTPTNFVPTFFHDERETNPAWTSS